MQSKLIVSKQKHADGHQSFPPQIALSKSNKHLDYKLKEKEAQLIKSKLPIDFLLINLQNDELHKYQEEYKGNALKNGLFVSKPDIMQQKKNEKKNEAKDKQRTSYAMNMQRIQQDYGCKYFEKQVKSMRERSFIQKPPTQNKTEGKQKINPIDDSRIQANEFAVGNLQNTEKSFCYQESNLIPEINNRFQERATEPLETMVARHFPQIYNNMQANTEILPLQYSYVNYHQNLHYYNNQYQIPFLQSGQLRYNPKYFEPKKEQSKHKSQLFRLFGLPYNEQHISSPKLNDIQKNFCVKILDRLLTHRSSSVFRMPISPQIQKVPDYHYIIHQPMDLQTILSKVTKNSYSQISEFHADINKIIVNSYKYNQRGTPYFIATVEFEDYYFDILKEVKLNPEEFGKDILFNKESNSKQEKQKYYAQLNHNNKQDIVLKSESYGRSEKNLKSTRVSKQKAINEDDNSQVFYQEISEPIYHEYQHENMINHISAESERKGNVMVHHRKYTKKTSNHSIPNHENLHTSNQNYPSENKLTKQFAHRKENKSMRKLNEKDNVEDKAGFEKDKQIERSYFDLSVQKSIIIKEQNEKLQLIKKERGSMPNCQKYEQNHQKPQNPKPEEQIIDLEDLQNFKFDLDQNSQQKMFAKQTTQNMVNTHKKIQKPFLFRSQISFEKLERLEEDQKQVKQISKNTNKQTQDIINFATRNIQRRPSRTSLPKHDNNDDDYEQFQIPSKIDLFDPSPTIKKNSIEQQISQSIPQQKIKLILGLSEELQKQEEKVSNLFKQQKLQTLKYNAIPVSQSAIIKKKSSKGDLLQYINLIDTESSKYKNLQKGFQAPQINAALQQTNLGHFDIDLTKEPIANLMPFSEFSQKQKISKRRKKIINDQEDDESGYEQYLEKQLQKLNKNKTIKKMKSFQSSVSNSSDQQARWRQQKNTRKVQENFPKNHPQLSHFQQASVNVQKAMESFDKLPSQIQFQQPKDNFLVNHSRINLESTSNTHSSEQTNAQIAPLQYPKDIFMQNDEEKERPEQIGIDFTDFFS